MAFHLRKSLILWYDNTRLYVAPNQWWELKDKNTEEHMCRRTYVLPIDSHSFLFYWVGLSMFLLSQLIKFSKISWDKHITALSQWSCAMFGIMCDFTQYSQICTNLSFEMFPEFIIVYYRTNYRKKSQME